MLLRLSATLTAISALLLGGFAYGGFARGVPAFAGSSGERDRAAFLICDAGLAVGSAGDAAERAKVRFATDPFVDPDLQSAAKLATLRTFASPDAQTGIHRIEISVADRYMDGQHHRRTYAYLVNARGCLVRDTGFARRPV